MLRVILQAAFSPMFSADWSTGGVPAEPAAPAVPQLTSWGGQWVCGKVHGRAGGSSWPVLGHLELLLQEGFVTCSSCCGLWPCPRSFQVVPVLC